MNSSPLELNVTRKMRIALIMIREDNHYICEWQTILRLAEAGYISYTDGRACITTLGRVLLATPRPRSLMRKPLTKAHPRPAHGGIKPTVRRAYNGH